MSPLAKGLGVLFGLPVLLSAVFFYYFLSTGEERMRASCAQIVPGMTLAQVTAFAHEHNLSVPAGQSGVTDLVEKHSFGGHLCRVTLDAGIVMVAEYAHNH